MKKITYAKLREGRSGREEKNAASLSSLSSWECDLIRREVAKGYSPRTYAIKDPRHD